MDDFRFSHEGRRFRIGTSIALVPFDNRWTTTAAILQAADTSCCTAKEAGRNRVNAWFDTDLAKRARQGEMQWTTRIKLALDEDRFALFVQRIQPLRGDPTGIHAPHVVFLSMHYDSTYRKAANNLGASGFIGKADFGEQLLPMIGRIAARKVAPASRPLPQVAGMPQRIAPW